MAADAKGIESLYACVGRSPFKAAVTREKRAPCPTIAAVEPSTSFAIPSMHRRPRIAACAIDSLLGGRKSKSAHALRSSSLYSGCGIPDSSADHSFRHGCLVIKTWNASASRRALSMLRRKGLANIAVGRFTGHVRVRARICDSPSSERGARSKFEVWAGRTISPCRTRTRVPVTRRSLRRPPRRRESDRLRPTLRPRESERPGVRGCAHPERGATSGGDPNPWPSHRARHAVLGGPAGFRRGLASLSLKPGSVISVLFSQRRNPYPKLRSLEQSLPRSPSPVGRRS